LYDEVLADLPPGQRGMHLLGDAIFVIQPVEPGGPSTFTNP
jgi:hypothetical protein